MRMRSPDARETAERTPREPGVRRAGTPALLHLQRQAGNGAVVRMVHGRSSPGPTVQRVGGSKFGLRPAEGANAEDLATLTRVMAEYKAAVTLAKTTAAAAFRGHEADTAAQSTYAQALIAAELTPQGLTARLQDSALRVTSNASKCLVTTRDGAVVAEVLRDARAYVPATGAAAGVAATYHKQTIAGPTAKEYVQIQGRMLRKVAYRGITPIEIDQIKLGGTVKPLYTSPEDMAAGQAGMHFEEGLGRYRDASNNDLAFLREFADVNAIGPEMYAFAQARKGVGKFFSLRSTPKDITSNHGAGFSSCGEIELDLAKVPESAFVFHYAGNAAATLESGIEGGLVTKPRRLASELKRARESLARNREIILSEYPAAAVRWKMLPQINPAAVRRIATAHGRDGRPVDFVLSAYSTAYDKAYDKAAQARGAQHGDADAKNGFAHNPDRTGSAYTRGYDSAYAHGTDWRHGYVDARSGRQKTRARITFWSQYVAGYTRGTEAGPWT